MLCAHNVLYTRIHYCQQQVPPVKFTPAVHGHHYTVPTELSAPRELDRYNLRQLPHELQCIIRNRAATRRASLLATAHSSDHGYKPLPPLPLLPTDILVTGATGFVGRFLVSSLLKTECGKDAVTGALPTVHVVIRASTAKHARKRMLQALSDAQIPLSKESLNRLEVHNGDVGLPGLGLSTDEYNGLATAVGTVFHVAAQLSYRADYSRLEKANVDGTRNVIEFCVAGAADTGCLKRLCHISTTAVTTPDMANESGIITETTALGDMRLLPAFGSCNYSHGKNLHRNFSNIYLHNLRHLCTMFISALSLLS
jgi:Male sterility protein